MGLLNDLAPAARPRERLLAEGADSLDDAALLALVLGTGRGNGDEDALELAQRMLTALGGVGGLAARNPAKLQKIHGIGPVKSARIVAALVLAERVAAAPEPTPPDDAALAERMRGQVPTGETVLLAVDDLEPGDPPMTLSLGDELGPRTVPGSILSHLVTLGQEHEWSLVLVRPGAKLGKPEAGAGQRLLAAAEMIGVPVTRLLVVSRDRHWRVTGDAA